MPLGANACDSMLAESESCAQTAADVVMLPVLLMDVAAADAGSGVAGSAATSVLSIIAGAALEWLLLSLMLLLQAVQIVVTVA